MSRQPAKVLEPDDVRLALMHVRSQRHPERNRVIILLSFKAGLRACEIAGITWPMLLATDGSIAAHISVVGAIAKYGSGRRIPINRQLRVALMVLHRAEGRPTVGPVIRSERGAAMAPGAIVNWFSATYRAMGLTVRPIPGGEPSSPARQGCCPGPEGPCATYRSWPGIAPSPPPSVISRATETPSISSSG